jgi:hypothetical protein
VEIPHGSCNAQEACNERRRVGSANFTAVCNDIDPSPYWDFNIEDFNIGDFNIAALENLSAPGSPKVATFGRVGQLH